MEKFAACTGGLTFALCTFVVVGGHPASLEAGQLALLGTRQRGLVPHDSWQPPQPPRFL